MSYKEEEEVNMAALVAGSITSNLKFTAKVPLLMKATSNDEKPIQGYDLQEISRISKSSLANCQSLLTFLLGRLEKKDPRIKFKVLHLMKYLVINGHSEFRSQLRHNAEAVKQTVNFKGELDPVHGDGLNVKVQQTALELEKLLFDVDNPDIEMIYKSMLAPDHSGKKMQGFGYTGAPEIKKEPTFKDTFMNIKKSGSEIFKMNKTKTDEFEPTPSYSQPQYTPVDLADSEVESSSGLGDGNDEEDEICDESDNEMNSDHYYERKLVHNITAEGGMTKIPSKEMLKDFIHKSSSLEIPVILDILDERLQSPSPNVQLKSLCVVECMLRSNLSNIPREINEHCPSIYLLAESQDQTVRAKANKIVLAVASCLKQDENQASSRGQVVVPPSYKEAKELPKTKENSNSETKHKVTKGPDFNSMFSGMNFTGGARPDLDGNRKLVKSSEPLVNIENTAGTALLENSDFSTMDKSNSKQNPIENDKQTTGKANPDLLSSATGSEVQSSNNFDLLSLEPGATSIHYISTPLQNRDLSLLGDNELKSNPNAHGICQQSEKDRSRYSSDKLTSKTSMVSYDPPLKNLDISLQKTGKKTLYIQESGKGRLMFNPNEATGQNGKGNNAINKTAVRPGNSNSSNVGSSFSLGISTQDTENLLLLNTEQQNHNPPNGLPQNASHIYPNRTVQPILQNPHRDLLTFQPRSQALPGGLVLPTNSSSTSPRRPFPKDMKSETDGFDFIRKSTKADAFSFINDEVQASKNKQK